MNDIKNPFKYFKTSPKIIRLAVMYYVRYPLSFRQVEDILHERGIDICYETVRFWVDRFGSKFAKEIQKKRAGQHSNWQWHLDEVFVKINDERFYLWRAVDHEGEVLECFVTKRRNKATAKKFLIKAMQLFKTAATLQSFVSYHSQIYNHFNHERHLQNRQTYKQKTHNRSYGVVPNLRFIDLCERGTLIWVRLCLTTPPLFLYFLILL